MECSPGKKNEQLIANHFNILMTLFMERKATSLKL